MGLSAARDIAEAAVVKSGGPNSTTSPLIANADDALLKRIRTSPCSCCRRPPATSLPTTSPFAAWPFNGSNGWYGTGPRSRCGRPTRPGRGVASTTSVDGGAAQTYSAPFTVATDGAHTVAFWSTDNDGNRDGGLDT